MENFSKLLILIAILNFYSCEPENPSPEHPSPESPAQEPPVQEPPVTSEEEEIIEVVDPNFKYVLFETNCVDINNDQEGDINVDLNNDGQLQISEVEAVESLIVELNFWAIIRSVNLKEIKYFKNLTYLEVTDTYRLNDNFIENTNPERITYDFTNLKELEILKLNYLHSEFYSDINLAGLKKLKILDLSINRPETIFYMDWESPIHFTRINMENCSNLTELTLINSFLIIDFCQIPSLKKLNMRYLEGGEPTTFDFHCLTELEWLDISENVIKELILKNNSILSYFRVEEIGSGYDNYSNYPYPNYICIDDVPEEHEQILTLINENTEVTTDCSFD